MVSDGNLRWYRTMLFGRSPGFAAGPATVGPWRPIRLVRLRGADLERVDLRPSLDGADGVLRAIQGDLERNPERGAMVPGWVASARRA